MIPSPYLRKEPLPVDSRRSNPELIIQCFQKDIAVYKAYGLWKLRRRLVFQLIPDFVDASQDRGQVKALETTVIRFSRVETVGSKTPLRHEFREPVEKQSCSVVVTPLLLSSGSAVNREGEDLHASDVLEKRES